MSSFRGVIASMAALALATGAVLTERAAPVGVASCDCEAQLPAEQSPTAQSPQPTGDLQGNISPAHDPTVVKDGRNYYEYNTGPGITMRTSRDRISWSGPSRVFPVPPAWTATTIPGSREFYWAPDVSYFNRRWHLYYSVSTFGRNRSAIGLATNTTLDPKRADYKWVDEGPVVQSHQTDNYNAIDPHVAIDARRQPWLTFGSFWSGIKLVKLDAKTGRPEKPNDPPIALAERSHEGGQPGAIEAAYITRHGRSYYLFASFDFCCRGVRSTYNIRVGRSKDITGPYVDRDGVAMLSGGGTLVLAGGDRWKGPGHNVVLRDGGKDYLVYHAYDAERNGAPTLRIEELSWDRDGWPYIDQGSAKRS